MIRIYFACILCLFFYSAKAQPFIGQNGCMSKTSPNRVYQIAAASYMGKPTYQGYGGVRYSEWTVQYDITTYPCVTWNPVQTDGCYIQTSASTYVLGNYGYFSGVAGTDCSIDSSILLLFIPVGFYAIYQVKKVREEDDE